jgi:hypothetical protein
MKHAKHPLDQSQNPLSAPRPTSAAASISSEMAFIPAPAEVARRAYFTYENQGSVSGHEVQHWLDAEAELIAERNLTRTHEFHRHHSF